MSPYEGGPFVVTGTLAGRELEEAVVVEIAALLSDGMPAKLAAITAAIADDVILADPAEFILGERPAVRFPAVWVLATDAVRPVEENLTDGEWPLGVWQHTVEIVVAATDPSNPEILRTRLYRYVRAITEVLMGHTTYVENVSDWHKLYVQGHAMTRVFQHVETNLFRQDAAVIALVTRTD